MRSQCGSGIGYLSIFLRFHHLSASAVILSGLSIHPFGHLNHVLFLVLFLFSKKKEEKETMVEEWPGIPYGKERKVEEAINHAVTNEKPRVDEASSLSSSSPFLLARSKENRKRGAVVKAILVGHQSVSYSFLERLLGTLDR